MDPCWFDDPIFDDAEAVLGGKRVRGDDWRRLQWLRETHGEGGELIPVAGTTHRRDVVAVVGKRKRDPVAFVPEPENKFDPMAMRVEVGGSFVGYVPRTKRVSPDAKAHVLKAGTEGEAHVWLWVTDD
jgi:hypothetical protein